MGIPSAVSGTYSRWAQPHHILTMLQVPTKVSKVPSECLNPEGQWTDKAGFSGTLQHLAELYSVRT